MAVNDETQPPGARWLSKGEAWVLELSGEWRGHRGALPDLPAPDLAGPVAVTAPALHSWDAVLAGRLWQQLEPLVRREVSVDLQGLPQGLQEILALALNAAPPAQEAPDDNPPPGLVTRVGARAMGSWDTRRQSLTFVGEVLFSLGRWLRGASDMRASDLMWQIEQTGPRSLPIVALVSFLVGLIVAYMGAAQLQRFGAQTYIADLVTVGVVREVAALLVGIVLAGRVGAAFAAQIGSMRANEEIDALTTLGVNPFDFLVLPRVLALLIVGPMLTAFGAVVGMAVGWLVAVVIYGVTPLEYVYASVESLTLPHVLVGLIKGTVYAALVALAGCRQGMAAGRSAQAVGDATTASVVQAIVWIVVAASVLTVVFQRLDV
ncbi:MAG: organic solvent ABC transporter permease [Burkholderiales bacterium RIFCSPLOWO2_12_67_14]|nr:MAG: organic solvent ABC transporter permease [Burkholderiales bacterium RIFCSPLOWO2_02_FULL_67_64]OGB49512.1 MAG: organic solvent ABC transporter permease [Burkholderiales bacterium RIFCSPLOWO2_12_67_14]OGB53434.1 MAG: organic solvent ABC transporter permease [Burkholderiales bacterium RIFCSPHIGHO2_12_FULL_67_38]